MLKFRLLQSCSNKAGSRANVTNTRAAGSQNSKPKVAKHSNSDQQDVEVVDLAAELSSTPYSKLAPREYRKLHSLHASVQKADTSFRLPKQKPQFSYASENQPDLPFLRKAKVKDADDIFGFEESDEEEDFPSLSAIANPSALAKHLKGDSDDPFESGNVKYEEAFQPPADLDGSLESLEVGMVGMDEPLPLRPPTPKINSSFANGVFDFEAFEENYGEPEMYSSPLISTSRKRELSPSPALPQSKYRRVSQDGETSSAIRNTIEQQIAASVKYESSTPSEIPIVESRRIKIQDLIEDPQPKVEQNNQQRSVPSWVNEFDADLIESLMGSVDFID